MTFFTWLESIQKKPDRTKKKILFASILIFMLFIIGIWLSLPDMNTQKEENKNLAGPFQLLWEEITKNIPSLQ